MVPDNLLGLAERRALSPRKVGGSAAIEHMGGMIIVREADPSLRGERRHKTYEDMLNNSTIIAAGIRYTLNMLASANWFFDPADETNEAQEIADFFNDAFFKDLRRTPWHRVVRRSGMYKYHGFSLHEWTAKKRDDGRIGFLEMGHRPQKTITRWDIPDDTGEVTGLVQTTPIYQKDLYIPRSKLLYLVEDTFSSSPEGHGMFRNLIKAYKRLELYESLETVGFQTDLQGIPVVRAPISDIEALVQSGAITEAEKAAMLKPYTDFIANHFRNERSGILLDSSVQRGSNASDGETVSSARLWDLELLQHSSDSQKDILAAIERINHELARVMNVEQMMLGAQSGSRALGESKTDSFLLVVDSMLTEIKEQVDNDLVTTLMNLNGIDDRLRPEVRHESVEQRDPKEMSEVLRNLALAGAPLGLNDPAVNDLRGDMGLSAALEEMIDMDDEDLALTGGEEKEEEEEEAPDADE